MDKVMEDIKAGRGLKPLGETPEDPRRILATHEAASITISKKEYETLIRGCERFRVLSNYIMNNEYYSVDTMRALVGYPGESGNND